jgi:hypothetical protein
MVIANAEKVEKASDVETTNTPHAHVQFCTLSQGEAKARPRAPMNGLSGGGFAHPLAFARPVLASPFCRARAGTVRK